MGPNGTGKSTLLGVVAGLIEPDAGAGERAAAGGIALIATHDEAFAEAIGARRVRLADGRIEAPA